MEFLNKVPMKKSVLHSRKVIPWIIALLLFSSFFFKQDTDSRMKRLIEGLEKFNSEFPQQKVYLHFDRNSYQVGETIWYKAYVFDAANHFPDTMSVPLYVEMINFRGARVNAKILHLKNGMAWGEFMLKDTLPEGNYTVRAFTNWMNNFDKDFFFEKSFYIENPVYQNHISSQQIKNNKRFNRKLKKKEKDFRLKFYPEGGELVEGIQNKVAFEATNGLGDGQSFSGYVSSGNGDRIDIKTVHEGKGFFYITPVEGENYTAHVSTEDDKELEFDLPEPLETGFSIETSLKNSHINFTIRTNRKPSADEFANEFLIIGQSRGNIYYTNNINLPTGMTNLLIPDSLFPTGILQLTLFNYRGLPLAERLIFVEHPSNFNIQAEGEKKDHMQAGEAEFIIKTFDNAGNGVPSHLSVAVTDTAGLTGNQNNMLSYMLLESDIKGKLNNPAYYFSGTDRAIAARDLVMMTNGWRRFAWEKLINEEYPEETFSVQKGLTIEGRITRNFFEIPVKQADVYLTIMDVYNDYYSTTTDDKGRFSFSGLFYPDTINVELEARKPNGKKNVVIRIDSEEPEANDIFQLFSREQEIVKKGKKWKYDNVKRDGSTELEEERARKLAKTESFKIYGDADNVIYSDEIPDSYSSLREFLKGRVPGMMVTDNSITIRGPSSIMLSNEPLVLVDGVPSDVSIIDMIDPRDVEVIEIIKGPNAAIYGSRGANGIIAIYTKRGDFMKKGHLDFQMLGFHTPREFYIPEKLTGREMELFRTIYWNPDLKTGTSGKGILKFKLPRNKGTYLLTLEGTDLQGNINSISFTVRVI